jgi:hypothetical protein
MEIWAIWMRHCSPTLGVFPSLDPFEGTMTRPMSLNGYNYVEGNPVNLVDPSGACINTKLNQPVSSMAETQVCQTQVSTLNSAFGITLTQLEVFKFDDVWTTTRVQNVYDAVLAISKVYTQSNLNFRSVFGGTSMTMRDGIESYCGNTPGRDNISWYQCNGFNDPYSRDNVIHELGHILQNRAGNINGFSMSGTWDTIERRAGYQNKEGVTIEKKPELGFANPDLRQNKRAKMLKPEDRLAEEVSDMFLFWIAGYRFSSEEGDEQIVGALRSAFVNGTTIDFDTANGGPVENPGILGWSRQAVGSGSGATTKPANLLVGYSRLIGLENLCLEVLSPLRMLI